ncbi:restriction endonuclease [Chloroflexota bacterium]
MDNKNADSAKEPISAASAQALWDKDKKEFELWALGLVGAKPKPHDSGVDGILGFTERGNKKQTIIVQVRGDKSLRPGMIDELVETIEKEGAAIGLIIALHKPTLGIITDSVHAGSYKSELWNKEFLKIQIRTVEELLRGKLFDIPQTYSLLKKVPKVKKQGKTEKLL